MIDGLWEKANQVNEIGYKIDSLAGIAELVAERISENAESGACWTIADLLKEYGERLEKLSQDIMLLNKEHEAVIAKLELKKGKKK
jgi:DNA polymerase/3'-5' exonuclease PolX